MVASESLLAWETPASLCFNPLHCGAVVASDGLRQRESLLSVVFQSPSLRGSGRFATPVEALASLAIDMFQSPSLRGSGRFAASAADSSPGALRFNPLHCGAVVASVPEWWTWDDDGAAGLNPLHCGAVVASISWHRSMSI